jgi:hypothetical protein
LASSLLPATYFKYASVVAPRRLGLLCSDALHSENEQVKNKKEFYKKYAAMSNFLQLARISHQDSTAA